MVADVRLNHVTQGIVSKQDPHGHGATRTWVLVCRRASRGLPMLHHKRALGRIEVDFGSDALVTHVSKPVKKTCTKAAVVLTVGRMAMDQAEESTRMVVIILNNFF